MGFDKFATKKRRREPYNVDVKLVEIYEDLASEKDEIRLRAAQGLVSQFTPDKNPTDEQIKKTLQRLFRGLCSSRKAARIGFSIALTEVLTQVFSSERESSEFGIADALKIWESQSNSTGSETGQVRQSRSSVRAKQLHNRDCANLGSIRLLGTTRSPLRPPLWCGSHHQVLYPVPTVYPVPRMDQGPRSHFRSRPEEAMAARGMWLDYLPLCL
jgi:hypothetical protein